MQPEFVVLIMWLCCGLPAAGRGGRSEVCTVCRLCCANYSLSYSQVPRPAWADLYTPHLVIWTTTNSNNNNSNTNNSVTMARTKKQLINQTVNQLKVKRIFSITWPLPCQWWWQCYSMPGWRQDQGQREDWVWAAGALRGAHPWQWLARWSLHIDIIVHYIIIPVYLQWQNKKYDQHW